ncbi:hypothetical protein V6N13_140179 [Hibiscus sabdariffa]
MLRESYDALSNGDVLLWEHHSSGTYNVKSTYNAKSGYNWLLLQQHVPCETSPLWKIMAKLFTLPKIRIFSWRLCYDAFPTASVQPAVIAASASSQPAPQNQGDLKDSRTWNEPRWKFDRYVL